MKFAPSRRADRGTFYRVSPVTGFGSPIGPPHLSPPRCRQHQELKGQPGGRHRRRFPHRPDHCSQLPMGQCLHVHCWGQAHRQLWAKLRHAGRAVEVFAVAWDQHHLDRTQRLLQAWTTRGPPAAKTEAAGLRQVLADADWDTVERHGGLNAVVQKINQWEQENPVPKGRGSIDNFRLRGSRRCRRIGDTATK